MIPEFGTPENKNSFEYLKELCEQGLEKKFPSANKEIIEGLITSYLLSKKLISLITF